MKMRAIWTIYYAEMARFFRTLAQSILAPVISTSLYFIVFGAALGARIDTVDGIDYAAFIVPGLIMLSVMVNATGNAGFGIYFPKFSGTIYQILIAPLNFLEVTIGYVGAAATKALFLGLLILLTATFFVEIRIAHPLAMIAFLVMTCFSFSLLGFIMGLWARNFEQLQLIPALIITPLVFLGGSFYSVNMLPGIWQKIAMLNPVVYLISGFRWAFFDTADVPVGISLAAIALFTLICLGIVALIFKTGWRLRS